VGINVLGQFWRGFEERAQSADALARTKDRRRQQLDAKGP
jgi:hypothetical protein